MNSKGSILLTGAAGFVGQTLVRALVERGYHVTALDMTVGKNLPPEASPYIADLRDPASLVGLPREWDGVIHLAGATIPSLFSSPAPVVINLEITLNLLDHLRNSRVLLASSCHVYAASGTRRKESDTISPSGLYGLSKQLVEQTGLHYLNRLDVRIARPFNHIGPGLRPELMLPSLLRRLAGLTPGDKSPVLMKGINSIRDFIDVRDVVSAYLAILEMEPNKERIFNVCSGRELCIEDIVVASMDILGQRRPIQFTDLPNSTDDIPYVVGDPSLLRNATGWTPIYKLEDSLSDMINKYCLGEPQ